MLLVLTISSVCAEYFSKLNRNSVLCALSKWGCTALLLKVLVFIGARPVSGSEHYIEGK